MRGTRLIVAGLALAALSAPGCVLTSAQILITYEDFPNPIVVSNLAPVTRQLVDLNTINDYNEHKDKLKGLTDIALLGHVQNGSTAVAVELWLTPGSTSHATPGQVTGDPTAVKLWSLALAANENRNIGWDESAGLFNSAGKKVLLDEIKGDGVFTLYLLDNGSAGTYSFQVSDAALVLVVDAGI
jgi:hypothetical protein